MCTSHHEIWQLRAAGLLEGKETQPMLYNIVDTRDIAQCARLSAESSVAKNGSRYLMVSTRGTGEMHVPEMQAMIQDLYPHVEVAGASEGKSRGALADTVAAREELGMDFHSIHDTLRATIDSTIELGYIQPKGEVKHTLFRWHDRLQPLLLAAQQQPKL